jgi:transporter family protein
VVPNTGWAIVTAVAAIGGLIMLYTALGLGDPTSVVPVSATYPAVTMALAAIVFSQGISLAKLAGTAMVIGGIVLITIAR